MTDFSKNATPKYSFGCLTDITVEDLKKANVKLVAIDLDNTSVYDCTIIPIKGVKKWVETVKNAGLKVVIISNSFKLRGRVMGKILGCRSYGPAAKPSTKMMYLAAQDADVQTSEMALIGDRLFTDVLGANDCGAVSFYVKPYKKEIFIPFYWRRARKAEVEYLKTLNINRDLKTIYYK